MQKIIKVSNFLIVFTLILFALLVVFIALPIFGNQALIVRSGSMTPTIGVGSIIVVRPNNSLISPVSIKPKYEVNDIIAFRSEKNSNTIITHRVNSYEIFNGTLFYKTKGDANEEIDNWQVDEKNILGKSFLTIPQAGKILAFAKSKYGFPALIIFPAFVVIILELINIIKELRKNSRLRHPRKPIVNLSGSEESEKKHRSFTSFRMTNESLRMTNQNIRMTNSSSNKYSPFFINFKPLKIIIPVLAAGILIPTTLAFYGDTETSAGNVLQAAASFPQKTPPIAQTLVMNEILPVSSCNSGQTNGQFVELWNGSPATVDLQNYSLNDGTNTIAIANANTQLPSNAYAILVKAEGVVNQCLGGNVNGAITVNLGGNIDLNTGLLRLMDTNGITVLDRVEFGASNSGVLQTIPDQSIERVILGQDSALGDTFSVSDFAKQCPVTPGTWSAPTDTCPVVINELMWMGNSESTVDEWIELRNMTSNSIDLTGWNVRGAGSGGGDLIITSGNIPANGFFLIANYSEANTNSVLNITPDFVTTTVSLGNENELYSLINNTGKIVDNAEDGSGAPLAGSNGTPKASMERNATPGNGALETNWHTATTSINFDPGATELGTPKAINGL